MAEYIKRGYAVDAPVWEKNGGGGRVNERIETVPVLRWRN